MAGFCFLAPVIIFPVIASHELKHFAGILFCQILIGHSHHTQLKEFCASGSLSKHHFTLVIIFIIQSGCLLCNAFPSRPYQFSSVSLWRGHTLHHKCLFHLSPIPGQAAMQGDIPSLSSLPCVSVWLLVSSCTSTGGGSFCSFLAGTHP